MKKKSKSSLPVRHLSGLKVKLVAIDLTLEGEIKWLRDFIHAHHSVPQFILPETGSLLNPAHFYFRAIGTAPPTAKGKLIGVTSFEERTPYLVETQRTIIAPKFRGLGWGKILSQAIEDQARRAGYYKVRSCIYVDNLAMIGIKLAQGYTIEGFHPDHDGPGLDEYSLGKILRRVKRA